MLSPRVTIVFSIFIKYFPPGNDDDLYHISNMLRAMMMIVFINDDISFGD